MGCFFYGKLHPCYVSGNLCMGSAFERPPPELLETGREVRFFANAAPKIELLPDGNFLICLALEKGDSAEAEAYWICSPTALAKIGRQLLTMSGEGHNIKAMRIIAGVQH